MVARPCKLSVRLFRKSLRVSSQRALTMPAEHDMPILMIQIR